MFPDFELRLCKGTQRYKERLKRLFPSESRRLKRTLICLTVYLWLSPIPNGPPKNWLDRLRYVFRHPVLMKYHRATYQQMLNHITRNPRLQAALSAHAATADCRPTVRRPFCA
jgi:hypothetical protein